MREYLDSAQDRERRRFFRIDDSVHLSLREISKDSLDQRLRDSTPNSNESFTLITTFNAINQKLAPALRRIEQAYPEIADYLKAVDQKIDLLARAFLTEEVAMVDKPARPVNLSAGGMSVESRKPMQVGTLLEVRLLLLPSFTGIMTYGEVVGCDNSDEEDRLAGYPYQVRVDFSFLRDEDRDALSRHVTLKQAEWLRSHRDHREF
jgi:hypothetical protein